MNRSVVVLVVSLLSAQAYAQGVASMRLQQVAGQKVPGAVAVTQPFGGVLSKKQSSSQVVTLLGGRCYTLLGTGGDGVKDVDLYYYDAQNKKVASDLGFDALPALTYCPTWPGSHKVEIVLKDGGGEVAAQLFLAPLPSSMPVTLIPPTNSAPDEHTKLIEQAAQTMPGATRVGDFYRGAGKDNEHADFTVQLEGGRCYLFHGAAASSMQALSLYLWDPNNKRVADERGTSINPVIRYCAAMSGPFHVQGKVVKGAGDFRMAVYALPPQQEPQAAAPSPAAGDPLSAAVIAQAPTLAPGYAQQGDVWKGAGSKNGHSDWTVPLESGHCYTFIGFGGAGVDNLSLYAWDPTGKRVADRRSNNSQSVMGVCPSMSGPFHLQAKIEKGQGEYRMGVYKK